MVHFCWCEPVLLHGSIEDPHVVVWTSDFTIQRPRLSDILGPRVHPFSDWMRVDVKIGDESLQLRVVLTTLTIHL